MSEDEQAIRDLVETWMRATRDGDTATVLSLMTEDAIFMVPGREPFGPEVFAAPPPGGAAPAMQGTSEIVELQVLGADPGAWAFSRNRIDLTVSTPRGEAVRRYGYTLTLYRKGDDSRWRLVRDANLLTVRS